MGFNSFIGNIFQRLTSSKPTKPFIDTEFATDESVIWKRIKLTPYYADDLLSRKKIDIYNDMMKDPEIESSINTLKTIRLSSGWEIVSASDDERDREIADFVRWNLENVEGSFDDDLREIMGALEMGVSINEIVWKVQEKGKYAGKIVLKSIKSKNPKYFNIYVDDFDNLRENGLVNISAFEYGREYPTEKFIIYSFNKRYENIFGTSRLRSLYDLWFIKKVLERAWGVFMEKYGMPLPIMKHPVTLSEQTKAYLLNVLKQLRFETGILIPEGIELQIEKSDIRGGSPFESAFSYINEQIRKTILGQTLTGSAGQVGSYSLGRVHFDILMFYVEQLGKDVAVKAVNQQLIERLVDYNFSDVEEYPKFQFKPLVQEDIAAIIDKYYAGVQNGIIKPIPEDEEKIRDWLKLPKRKVERNPEIKGQSELKLFAENNKKLFTGVRRRTFTEYEEKVDFANIKDVLESNTEEYTVRVSKIIEESIQDLYKEIEKKKIISEKNMKAVDDLHLKYLGDVKREFENMLNKIFEQAIRDGRRTLIEKKKALKFQDIDFRKMTPKEVLDFWKNKSYFMTQMERDNIWKILKPIIFNTIKTGGTIKDFIQEADKQLEQYFYKGEIEDYEKYTGHRLETIIRTNISEAYNYGLRHYFESPELEGFVQAYQYSAILDDRVRPNHSILDGRIFSVTNPVIERISPPNGYNCRCVLVPIVEGEKWEESELPSGWHADEGFDKPGAV